MNKKLKVNEASRRRQTNNKSNVRCDQYKKYNTPTLKGKLHCSAQEYSTAGD